MKTLFNSFSDWLLAPDLGDMQKEISSRNGITLYRISQISILVTLLDVLNQSEVRVLYAVICSLLLLTVQVILAVIIYRHRPAVTQSEKATLCLYLYESLLLLCSMLCGTFLGPDHYAISFLIFLAVFPVLILDAPWRIILYMSVWNALFLCCSHAVKTPHLFHYDLIHILISFVGSLICLSIVLSSRLDEIRSHAKLLENDRTDSLTHLYNRRYFLYLAEKEIDAAKARDKYSIIYYDFNNIRDFNREYGFDEGDNLLKEFAHLLQQNYAGRICARFGEDHFVTLAKKDEWETITQNLTKDLDYYIVKRFGRHMITDLSGMTKLPSVISMKETTTMPLSIRCGVCDIPDSASTEIACDHARIACHYHAQDSPFNYKIYDDSINRETQNESYVLQHIDEAIRDGRIRVFYQPIARAATDQVSNEEALARWDDPTFGLLPPSEFIPVLERHGLLFKVDFYVLEQVLRDFETRRKAGMRVVPVSINLSRNDFYGHDAVEEVCRRVDAAHCPHNMIDIEITESAYAADSENIMQAMNRFHEAGFRVWMDDFGSGYSSLNLLKDSPFDLIKLDMRFMQNFDSRTEIVVGSILSMASQMGIDTLAEGVETAQQRNALRHLGCGRLQGYYYSKPLPLEKIMKYQQSSAHLVMEDHAHASYYDQVSRVNLAEPLTYYRDPLVEGLTDSLPAAISQWDDQAGTLLILRANTAFERAQTELSDARYDFSVIGTTDRFTYVPKDETAEAIRECIRTGSWVTMQIVMKNKQVAFYIHAVGNDEVNHKSAVLFVAIPSRIQTRT